MKSTTEILTNQEKYTINSMITHYYNYTKFIERNRCTYFQSPVVNYYKNVINETNIDVKHVEDGVNKLLGIDKTT
jgi:hypothetical protein